MAETSGLTATSEAAASRHELIPIVTTSHAPIHSHTHLVAQRWSARLRPLRVHMRAEGKSARTWTGSMEG
jgi:hypothetical protein